MLKILFNIRPVIVTATSTSLKIKEKTNLNILSM